jgi:hypothetical protein
MKAAKFADFADRRDVELGSVMDDRGESGACEATREA